MHATQAFKRPYVLQAAALALAAAVAALATADVTYQSQTRHVMYEIECGDPYNSDFYDDSVTAPDFGLFEESLYRNIKWPSEVWTDVEGRASVSQTSSLTNTLISATGDSHIHAYVEEDQTSAYAQALAESFFQVEFDLTAPTAVNLVGETNWVRSTVDPPREVLVSVTLYQDGLPLFSHAREYTYPSGVIQDDGDTFAFADALPIGSYALEIIAYTEAYSQGPWRQYAEATSSYDVTMNISLPGDLDGDCDVDLADLAQLLANYGVTSGAVYEDGDLDLDGDVDLADLAALLAVFGASCK